MSTVFDPEDAHLSLETLPLQCGDFLTMRIFLGILRNAPRSTLFNLLFVCRTWSVIVNRVLLEETDFSVFLAVSPLFTVQYHTIQYGAVPTGADWARFQGTHGRFIKSLSDRAYSALALDPGPFLFTGVFACPAYIFFGLHTLKVDIEHLRPPVLCRSLINLTFSITKSASGNVTPFYHPEIASISTTLRTAAYAIPDLRNLRIDGDDSLSEFTDDIAIFCEHLVNLVSIELSPYAMSRRLFFVISKLPHLKAFRLLETGQDGIVRPMRDVAALTYPTPELEEGSFHSIQELAIWASSPSLCTSIIVQPNMIALNLQTIWFRHSSQYPVVPEEVRYLLYSIGLSCPHLESLTMRFASYGWDITPDAINHPLTFYHLRVFYSIRRLVHFAIDHCFPIYFTRDELHDIAANCREFKSLFLNPYPTCHTRAMLSNLPPMTALEPFALFCPSLERLGVLFDASEPLESTYPPKFVCLQELHVGWSLIPGCAGSGKMSPKWHALALYFSHLFPQGTKVKTVHGGRAEDDPSRMMLAPMRARCRLLSDFDPTSRHRSLTWSAVWAMATWLRRLRRWENEGVRDGVVHGWHIGN